MPNGLRKDQCWHLRVSSTSVTGDHHYAFVPLIKDDKPLVDRKEAVDLRDDLIKACTQTQAFYINTTVFNMKNIVTADFDLYAAEIPEEYR